MKAQHKSRQPKTLRVAFVGVGVIGVLAALGVTYVVGHHNQASATGTPATTGGQAPTGGQTIGGGQASSPSATTTKSAGSAHPTPGSHHPATTATKPPASTTTLAPVPLTLAAVTPTAGATDIALNAPITVTFSAPLARTTPTPIISPAAAGSWTIAGSTMTFTPSAGWVPYSTVTVTVPAGIKGATSQSAPTAQTTTASFVAAPGSTVRLQQLLAELGYLPVTFTPKGTTAADALASEPSHADQVASVPVVGAFAWSYPNTPASLMAQWNADTATVVTRGAVMAFESDHGLTTDGTAGPGVWSVLLLSAATHAPASHPYSYVMVSETEPEMLQVWEKGAIVASTLANTGASGAATELGTYPVFERFASTTMTGTNPNGSKYKDYGVLWVAYFNGGDAVHEFYRPGYGYPQSNGCVELPSTSAPAVWQLDPIGTLVTVA